MISFLILDPQEHVYREIGTSVVDNAFNGYNGCIFAYGQTGFYLLHYILHTVKILNEF
jgi:hypothetical protein